MIFIERLKDTVENIIQKIEQKAQLWKIGQKNQENYRPV